MFYYVVFRLAREREIPVCFFMCLFSLSGPKEFTRDRFVSLKNWLSLAFTDGAVRPGKLVNLVVWMIAYVAIIRLGARQYLALSYYTGNP